ncbi:hypothetical protein Bhyg_02406 [Pseudolycoriella hygida]|uniref:Uncharacterized protein n=1 Tax=Pseudolycoriella hygida TaxID=35572 RepID=A0A9Q0NBB6_9DIPT|nr:hypothetical protein Bhyg_02406 [Pseudolycoriella hygida]
MKIVFVLLFASCVIGFGESSVFDKTIPFAETNLIHTGFDEFFNAAGTDIGCPGCPFYNGGNCFECCTQNGYSSGGSCGGFLYLTCFCVGRARHVTGTDNKEFSQASVNGDAGSDEVMVSEVSFSISTGVLEFSFRNVDKREVFEAVNEIRSYTIGLDEVPLSVPFVDKVKDLGLIIDENLKWREHVQAVVGKFYAGSRSLWVGARGTPLRRDQCLRNR